MRNNERQERSVGISFIKKLEINVQECTAIAFVGGGGKTSLIFRLADELTEAGKKTVIVTTTHMAQEPDRPLAENGELWAVRRNLSRYGYTIAAVTERESGKLCGLPDELLRKLKRECDVMLIEADGSRRLPLKVPEAWEPVIPEFADTVVGVAGLDALGRPIRLTAHRPGLTAAFLEKKPEEAVVPEDIVRIAASKIGMKKNVGNRLYRVYLNKADILPSSEIPEYICRELKINGVQAAYGSLHYEEAERKKWK